MSSNDVCIIVNDSEKAVYELNTCNVNAFIAAISLPELGVLELLPSCNTVRKVEHLGNVHAIQLRITTKNLMLVISGTSSIRLSININLENMRSRTNAR